MAQTLQHGQYIFIYNNIRTNQVIYSLTRALNNHASLKQLPFLGKKTVPASLRKDLWQPFAMVEFPRPVQGLVAFRKLREFRRLHETSYPLDIITQTEGPHKGQLLGTKKRGKVLMNQKANSVADLAAVLLQQEQSPTTEQIERTERRVQRVEQLKRQKGPEKVKAKPILATEMRGTDGVKVRWVNILDAEFAATWPAAVVHEVLGKSRYTAAFPPVEITAMSDQSQLQWTEPEDSGAIVSSNLIDGSEEAAAPIRRTAITPSVPPQVATAP